MKRRSNRAKTARAKASAVPGVKVQRRGEMEYERGPGSKFEMEGRGLTRRAGIRGAGTPRSARGRTRMR